MPSFFGSKKDKSKGGSPAPENPYAQQQAAPDAYTNDVTNDFAKMNPYAQQQPPPARAGPGSGLPSGPRAGGLPSGPGPRGPKSGFGAPSPSPGPGSRYGAPAPAPARADSDNKTVDTLPRYSPTGDSSQAPAYSSSKYGASGGYGGNRYDNSGPSGPAPNRGPAPGARGAGGYGGLGRNDTGDDENRDALLGGAKQRYATQEQSRPSASGGGYGSYGNNNSSSYGGYGEQRELTAEELEEEELRGTKNEIKEVKNQTMSSLENSLRYIDQAEEMARGTLGRIGSQNERLHNTDRNLDLASNHNLVAEERAKELKKLNGSMFAVHVNNPFTKKSRKEAQDAETLRIHQEQRDQRLATRKDQFDQSQRMEDYNKKFERTEVPAMFSRPSAAENSRFMLPGDDEDEEEEDRQKEERIAMQLEMASKGVGRLKQYGMAMGEEIEKSNQLIDRLGNKSDRVDDQVRMNRARIDRIK